MSSLSLADRQQSKETAPQSSRPGVPLEVWLLGFVSLLTDISSEMIFAVLPVYLAATHGISITVIGTIEGVAEATAAVVKIWAGMAADRLGRYRGFIIGGYAISAVTKLVFPLAGAPAPIFAARIIDRVGKGVRVAPRDALIARVSPRELLGTSFGLRQMLDSIGAVIGPLLAIGIMAATADNFHAVFWVAVIPGIIGVAVLTRLKDAPPLAPAALPAASPAGMVKPVAELRWHGLGDLGRAFWWLAAVAVVLTLGRGAKAFLVLRAENVGTVLWLVPLVFVVMNLVYAVTAYPAGILADRVNRYRLLTAGIVLLVICDLLLAIADGPTLVMVGVLFWGLHFGATQGVLATLIAAAAPDALRGTAFGVFNLATGLAMVTAGTLGGVIWDVWGPDTLFTAGFVASLAAFALSLKPPR